MLVGLFVGGYNIVRAFTISLFLLHLHSEICSYTNLICLSPTTELTSPQLTIKFCMTLEKIDNIVTHPSNALRSLLR